MGAFKNAITKLRHGLAKVTPQGSHLHHPEPFTDGDVVDGKEQPGRGPDDKPVHRESQGIIPTPHFS
jgi:hypothetical protein